MKRCNVTCPACGRLNEGVDLEKTQGWVECIRCNLVFMAPRYAQNVFRQMLRLGSVPSYSPDTARAIAR